MQNKKPDCAHAKCIYPDCLRKDAEIDALPECGHMPRISKLCDQPGMPCILCPNEAWGFCKLDETKAR